MNPVGASEAEMGVIKPSTDGALPGEEVTNIKHSLTFFPEFLRKIKCEATEVFLEAKPRLDLIDIKFSCKAPFVKAFKTKFTTFFGNERIKVHQKKKKRCLKKLTSFRWRTYLKIIPGVNLVYDMFFSESTPTQKAIFGLLDIVGLLNGLLLSSAIALVIAVSYQECSAADSRFISSDSTSSLTGYQQFWSNNYGSDYPSKLLFDSVHNAICFVFAAITGVVYIYSDLVAKITNDDALVDVEKREEEWYFELWWKYARFGIIILLAFTVSSCYYIVDAVNILFLIKYPDYQVATFGRAYNTQSPIYGMYRRYRLIFTIGGIIMSLVCGIGTARVHIEKIRIDAAYMYRAYFAYSDRQQDPYYIDNRIDHKDKDKRIDECSIERLESLMNLQVCRTMDGGKSVTHDDTYLHLLKMPPEVPFDLSTIR